MILYHGSNTAIEAIDLECCMPYKDFGRGFYLTSMPNQAEKMAGRTARFYGGDPVVTRFEAPDDLLTGCGLNVKVFGSVSEEWARFIMNNRDRNFTDVSSPECNADCKYDVVFGPVGNDDVTYLLRQYTRGSIGGNELRRGLEYKKASDQYSFHTHAAVALLGKGVPL